MKKIKLFVIAASAATAFTACDKGPFPDYEKTGSGVYFRFFDKKEGDAKPKQNDFVVVNMKLMTQADTVLFDSKKVPNSPEGGIMFPLTEGRMTGNLEEGLTMMNKVDSASFIILADSVYRGGQLPKNVISGSYIKFFVRLINFRTKDDVMAEQKRLGEEMKAKSELARQDEAIQREKYLADNKIKAKPSATGLYYVETKRGSGDLIKLGQTVTMKYTGKLLNGEIFDSSDNHGGQGYPFAVGGGQVIPGWDEAAQLMRKGGKATIIIPSSLGYGEQGSGPIPPFSSLVFDVEAVDVK